MIDPDDGLEYLSFMRFNLFGYIDEESSKVMVEQMWMHDNEEPDAAWEVCLNTEGGNMEAGTAIYSELVSHSVRGGGTHHVTTRVRGQAASCGALILQAGDRRIAGRMDYIMLHEPLMSFTDAPMQRVRDELAQAEMWTGGLLDVVMERGTMNRAFYEKRIRGHDWWIPSQTAFTLGLLDEVA